MGVSESLNEGSLGIGFCLWGSKWPSGSTGVTTYIRKVRSRHISAGKKGADWKRMGTLGRNCSACPIFGGGSIPRVLFQSKRAKELPTGGNTTGGRYTEQERLKKRFSGKDVIQKKERALTGVNKLKGEQTIWP